MHIAASLFITLLLLAGPCAVTPAAAAQSFSELDRPVPIPAFSLPGLGGNGGSDADLRNKVTIIRFWASW